MPVIATRFARTMPMTAPIATATTSSTAPITVMPRATASTRVATSARAMPAMPKALPDRAVSWRDSPARARMNSSAATRYAALAAEVTVMISSLSAASEHGEHAPGHGETAEDVDGGQQDRQRRDDRDPDGVVADLQQGPDDDDAGDRVGHRHQRGVQGVVHVPDHVVAD